MPRKAFVVCKGVHLPGGGLGGIAQVHEEGPGPRAVHGGGHIIGIGGAFLGRYRYARDHEFRRRQRAKVGRQSRTDLVQKLLIPGEQLLAALVAVGQPKARIIVQSVHARTDRAVDQALGLEQRIHFRGDARHLAEPERVHLLGGVIGRGHLLQDQRVVRRTIGEPADAGRLRGGGRPLRFERRQHACVRRVHAALQRRGCIARERGLQLHVHALGFVHSIDKAREQRVVLRRGRDGILDADLRLLQQRQRRYDTEVRLALHLGRHGIQLVAHRLQAPDVVAGCLRVLYYVSRLQERR
jgi:hypothetical protein